MARESKITRTIQTTEATVLCLDVENSEPCNRTFVLPRTYKKDSEILKAVTKLMADEPGIKPVHVVDTEVKSTLYGMPESEFLKHAHPIVKGAQPEDEEVTEA